MNQFYFFFGNQIRSAHIEIIPATTRQIFKLPASVAVAKILEPLEASKDEDEDGDEIFGSDLSALMKKHEVPNGNRYNPHIAGNDMLFHPELEKLLNQHEIGPDGKTSHSRGVGDQMLREYMWKDRIVPWAFSDGHNFSKQIRRFSILSFDPTESP